MSTTLEVSEEIAAEVRRLVDAGRYPDADTAIQEAFRLLHEQQAREELWAKLEEANQQIERGEFVEWNEETRQRIVREGRAKFERGHKPKPDVCP